MTRTKGFIQLRALFAEETRWFATAGREFGLWYLTIHGFGLYFGIIGPFEFRMKARA